MKITYDPEADAAYIQLVDEILPGQAAEQIPLVSPGGKGKVILDFDSDGKLLGVEILWARDVLPESAIQSATRIGNVGVH